MEIGPCCRDFWRKASTIQRIHVDLCGSTKVGARNVKTNSMKQQLKSSESPMESSTFREGHLFLDAKLEEFHFRWKKYTPEV